MFTTMQQVVAAPTQSIYCSAVPALSLPMPALPAAFKELHSVGSAGYMVCRDMVIGPCCQIRALSVARPVSSRADLARTLENVLQHMAPFWSYAVSLGQQSAWYAQIDVPADE